MEKRKNKILKLRGKGFSLRKIGKMFSISGERVRQIICDKDKIPHPRISSDLEIYLTSVGKSEGRDRAREMVRLRDNHKCVDCGYKLLTKDVLKYNLKITGMKGKIKSLDVHHINGLCGKNSQGYDSPKDISMMVTLCHKCHFNRKEHRCKSEEYALSKSV